MKECDFPPGITQECPHQKKSGLLKRYIALVCLGLSNHTLSAFQIRSIMRRFESRIVETAFSENLKQKVIVSPSSSSRPQNNLDYIYNGRSRCHILTLLIPVDNGVLFKFNFKTDCANYNHIHPGDPQGAMQGSLFLFKGMLLYNIDTYFFVWLDEKQLHEL